MCFELLGSEQNIIHISLLTEKAKINATLSNTTLSSQEQRALMLLDMISRIVGINRNVFAIGDLMVLKHVTIDAIGKEVEHIEDKYIAMHDTMNDKIYVDRSTIDKSKLRDDLDEELDLSDYKFILLNLRQIVMQLTMLKEIKNKEMNKLHDAIINTLAVA